METIKFNTGRMYGHTGQRSAAAHLDNGDIVFLDIDRGIDGLIPAGNMSRDDVKYCGLFSQRDIMRAYDENSYKSFYLDDGFATARQLRALAETVEGAK